MNLARGAKIAGAARVALCALLVSGHRKFMALCSYWASVNREFKLPRSAFVRCLDWTTMLWSAVIALTTLIKFFKYPEKDGLYNQSDRAYRELSHAPTPAAVAAAAAAEIRAPTSDEGPQSVLKEALAQELESQAIDWTQLLLLNTLPRINQFSALYYGLVLTTVSTAFVWRLYTNYLRRPAAGGCQFGATCGCTCTLFNSAIEAIQFFLAGPPGSAAAAAAPGAQDQEQVVLAAAAAASTATTTTTDDQVKVAHGLQGAAPSLHEHLAAVVLRAAAARRGASTAAGRPPRKGPLELASSTALLARRRALLTRAHINEFGPARDKCASSLARTNFTRHKLSELRPQVYQIPIGSADFHRDKSAQRWRFLALHVYALAALIIGCTLPLSYLTIMGLSRVNQKFGPRASEMMAAGSVRARINLALSYYAPMEQAYAISQCAIFFIFTNIIIALFHADILYKARPLRAEFAMLTRLYREQLLDTLPMVVVRRQQLRIWAYFHQIKLVDNFLSKYSVVSLVNLVAGLSLAQSFAQIQDTALKLGTFAALFSNVLSFSYLHFISEHIERQSVPLQTGLLTILAHERLPEAKREWQRTLNGFFQADWKRTFTINGKYPTNLRTYCKTATALLAACTLVHRLFHRSQWTVGFGGPTAAAAAAAATTTAAGAQGGPLA